MDKQERRRLIECNLRRMAAEVKAGREQLVKARAPFVGPENKLRKQMGELQKKEDRATRKLYNKLWPLERTFHNAQKVARRYGVFFEESETHAERELFKRCK